MTVETTLLSGFNDSTVGCDQWNHLLRQAETDTVFLTWQFQRAWWESLGEGKLLLIAAERDGKLVAIAPLYADDWSICFIGKGVSEWLDFVGDVRDDEVVHALLEKALEHASPSANFELDPLPMHSGRLNQLERSAGTLRLPTWHLVEPVTPVLDIASDPARARNATNKQSLVRHERFFRRSGELVVEHFRDGEAILPHLPAFFDQHVARWAVTSDASPFEEPEERAFVERLTKLAAKAGWLRFTRIVWNERPIAFHFGFSYGGRYHWWRPSFAIDLAQHSPGEVLLRHLLLAALDEGATVFDFGLGDLPFKRRFASRVDTACWWGTERLVADHSRS